MCQRYVLPDQATAEREFLPGVAWWKFVPSFNVSPGQNVPAIRLHDRRSEGVMLRWGFIPSWFEGQLTGPARTSVEIGRIDRSPSYRMPWLGSQRCLIPVAGFYVWQLTPSRYRRPFYVQLNQRAVFGIAAIWDRWVSDEDEVTESCSIITVPANSLLAGLDAEEGMPAILRRKDYAGWLEGTPVQAKAMLAPYKSEWMHAHPVSPRINSLTIDDAALILPVDSDAPFPG